MGFIRLFPSPAVLLSALLLLSAPSLCHGECDYVNLVKCFIEVLDEWAWTLYETKDNVVAVSDTGCGHFYTIRKCIVDGHDTKHGCNNVEVIEASRTVSDLLTHRKHSGTFLKSYFLLEYACDKGRDEVRKHEACLKNELIGEQTLSAATYLEEKFRETKPPNAEAACSLFTEKITKFRNIIAQQNLCGGEAEKLMCESLKGMFLGVEPDLLGSCEYDCFEPDGVATTPAAEEIVGIGGSSPINGNAPTGTASSLPLGSLSLLGLAALLL